MWNLKGIRTAAQRAMDWAPDNAPDHNARFDEFINRAYYKLLQEAPFLFFVQDVRMTLEPDVEMAGPTDTLSMAGDAWTVVSALDAGVGTPWADTTNGRVFDGRNILIRDSDGVWHENQIREVFLTATGKYSATLVYPWKNATDTGLSWRIQTNEFPLPENVVQINSMVLSRDQLDYPLSVIGETHAEYASLTNDARLLVSGVPRWCFRRQHHQIETPTLKPTTSTAQDAWDGAGTPPGTFQVVYTYAFGKNEVWRSQPTPLTMTAVAQDSTRYRPWWESGQSPASDVFTAAGSVGVRIALPNVDAALGFNSALTPRYQRSGIKKRIYLKRITQTSGATLETPDTYYFYDEVDSDVTSYVFDGSRVMDTLTRVPEVHGYQTLRFHPTPDTRYEVRARAVVRPPRLTDDYDVPRVHADAIEALINKTVVLAREAEGNYQAAVYADGKYNEALNSLKNRYGDARPDNRALPRRNARARNTHRLRRQFPLTE